VDSETGFVAAAPGVSLLEQTLERAWNHCHGWQRMGTAPRRQAERLIPIDPVGDFCREIVKGFSVPDLWKLVLVNPRKRQLFRKLEENTFRITEWCVSARKRSEDLT